MTEKKYLHTIRWFIYHLFMISNDMTLLSNLEHRNHRGYLSIFLPFIWSYGLLGLLKVMKSKRKIIGFWFKSLPLICHQGNEGEIRTSDTRNGADVILMFQMKTVYVHAATL